MKLIRLTTIWPLVGAPAGSFIPPPPLPTAPDLFSAAKARFTDAGLNSTLTGGLWHKRAKAGTPMPYALLIVRDDRRELITSTSTHYRATLRLTAVAGSLGGATLLANALADAFEGQALAWDTGRCRVLRGAGRMITQDSRQAREGGNQYELSIDLETRLTGRL